MGAVVQLTQEPELDSGEVQSYGDETERTLAAFVDDVHADAINEIESRVPNPNC